MREIKFRVWDMKHNEYIYWDELKAIPGVLGMLLTGKLTNSIIEQFTGLHDYEGKEIYEGDIVLEGGLTGIIEWDNKFAKYICRMDLGTTGMYLQRMKIIGNIHEVKQ